MMMEVMDDIIVDTEVTLVGVIQEVEKGHILEAEVEATVAEVIVEVEAQVVEVEVEVWTEEEILMIKKEVIQEVYHTKKEGEIIEPYQNQDQDQEPTQDHHHGPIKEDIR